MTRIEWARVWWAVSLALAVASILAIRMEIPRIFSGGGLWDFGAFVASGRAAAEGLNPYGVYPPLTPHVVLPGFESWNPNLNPPISALLFQLFDLAEPHEAFRIWRWFSIACYGLAVLLLLRRYATPAQAPLLALWAFALAGFWDTLFLGQIYLPLVLAATAAWLLLERGRRVWAGILIGLVVAMKPNFLVWPVLLFLSGHRRPALVSLGITCAVSAVPLLVFGPEIYRQWIELIVSDGARAAFLTNASLSGLAARAGVPVLGLVASAALLASLALWALRRHPPVMRVSALALAASVLASPIGWIHYTLFLLPVLLSERHRPVMLVVTALLIVPVPYIINQLATPTWVQITTGSVYGWALVLLLAALLSPERGQEEKGLRTPESELGRRTT